MWSVVTTLAVGVIVAVIEVPSLIKRKKWKEIWVFSFLLLAGIILNIAVGIGIEVPSPLEWIRKIYGVQDM